MPLDPKLIKTLFSAHFLKSRLHRCSRITWQRMSVGESTLPQIMPVRLPLAELCQPAVKMQFQAPFRNLPITVPSLGQDHITHLPRRNRNFRQEHGAAPPTGKPLIYIIMRRSEPPHCVTRQHVYLYGVKGPLKHFPLYSSKLSSGSHPSLYPIEKTAYGFKIFFLLRTIKFFIKFRSSVLAKTSPSPLPCTHH